MLWWLALALAALWGGGIVLGLGGPVHVLLVLAIAVTLFQLLEQRRREWGM